jgi:hypothetical protein
VHSFSSVADLFLSFVLNLVVLRAIVCRSWSLYFLISNRIILLSVLCLFCFICSCRSYLCLLVVGSFSFGYACALASLIYLILVAWKIFFFAFVWILASQSCTLLATCISFRSGRIWVPVTWSWLREFFSFNLLYAHEALVLFLCECLNVLDVLCYHRLPCLGHVHLVSFDFF